VQKFGALFLPSKGDCNRIIGEDGLLLKVTLKEAYATARLKVYGRNNFHIWLEEWVP
jgi:hypothetical protein